MIINYFKLKHFRSRKKKHHKEAQERSWLDSAGSSIQVQKEQHVLLFRSKKMRCFPQDGDSGQCFNLQSKL